MTGNRVAMRILEDATDEIQTGGLLNKRTLEKLPQVFLRKFHYQSISNMILNLQRKQQPDPN